MYPLDDTIAAIASAPGGAARGIVRLSGPKAVEILNLCFDCGEAQFLGAPANACVTPGHFRAESLAIPADLLLWPQGRSYTRQLAAEIHTAGSPPVLETILQTVCRSGARLAAPGEFTLRAFLAGRIDLTQAEAVLGVIDAADRNQLHSALEQLAGGLARPLNDLRSDLLDLLADLEAGLDFAEEDIHFVTREELNRRLAAAAESIQRIAAQLNARETATFRPRVTIFGLPNVGKSSLFNALVGEAAALVSAQPGTTRDYLSATVDLGDMSIDLVDTAGILGGGQAATNERNESDIDGLSQQAASHQCAQSDFRLLCIDSTRRLNQWEQSQLKADRTLAVLTKCDRPRMCQPLPEEIATSSRAATGIAQLLAAIRDRLASIPSEGFAVASTAARARESIRTAVACLASARQVAGEGSADELVSAEVRSALLELGKIVGAVYTDDLLDRIFSRFCIGK